MFFPQRFNQNVIGFILLSWWRSETLFPPSARRRSGAECLSPVKAGYRWLFPDRRRLALRWNRRCPQCDERLQRLHEEVLALDLGFQSLLVSPCVLLRFLLNALAEFSVRVQHRINCLVQIGCDHSFMRCAHLFVAGGGPQYPQAVNHCRSLESGGGAFVHFILHSCSASSLSSASRAWASISPVCAGHIPSGCDSQCRTGWLSGQELTPCLNRIHARHGQMCLRPLRPRSQGRCKYRYSSVHPRALARFQPAF